MLRGGMGGARPSGARPGPGGPFRAAGAAWSPKGLQARAALKALLVSASPGGVWQAKPAWAEPIRPGPRPKAANAARRGGNPARPSAAQDII